MSHDVQDDVYSTFAVSVRLLMEELHSTLDEWYTNIRTNSAAKALLDTEVANGTCHVIRKSRRAQSVTMSVPAIIRINKALGSAKYGIETLAAALSTTMRSRDYVPMSYVAKGLGIPVSAAMAKLQLNRQTYSINIARGRLIHTVLPTTDVSEFLIPYEVARDVLSPLGSSVERVLQQYSSTHPVKAAAVVTANEFQVNFMMLCSILNVDPNDYAKEIRNNVRSKHLIPSAELASVETLKTSPHILRSINSHMGTRAFNVVMFDKALALASSHPQFISLDFIAADMCTTKAELMDTMRRVGLIDVIESGGHVGASLLDPQVTAAPGAPYLTRDLSYAVANALGVTHVSIVSKYWHLVDAQATATKPTPPVQVPKSTLGISSLRVKAAKAMAQANMDRETGKAYLESAAKNYAEAYAHAEAIEQLLEDTAYSANQATTSLDIANFTDARLRLSVDQYAILSGIAVSRHMLSKIERKARAIQGEVGIEDTRVETDQFIVYMYPVSVLTKAFTALGYIE